MAPHLDEACEEFFVVLHNRHCILCESHNVGKFDFSGVCHEFLKLDLLNRTTLQPRTDDGHQPFPDPL